MSSKKRVYFVFDDRLLPQKSIINVVGNSSFGEILHKRERLIDKIQKTVYEYKDVEDFFTLKNDDDLKSLEKLFMDAKQDSMIVHIMSYCVIIDKENFMLALRKSMFSNSVLATDSINPLIYYFPNPQQYVDFIDNFFSINNNPIIRFSDKQVIKPNEHAIDISDFQNFLQFFSGGFEARYFNSLKGDSFSLTKTSTDKKKIQKEHDLYNLLPSEIKNWFVAPYNLVISDEHASYTMERLNIPDMALQWIHSAITPSDLEKFLEKIFFFIKRRPVRNVSPEAYKFKFHELYFTKVIERIENLKKIKEFEYVHRLVASGTEYRDIDEIISEYEVLYKRLELRHETAFVVGHGDLCFSNILYDKNTNLMKFIDPKGALTENEIWMDPYYDIAKLSHSIFGCYDFINNEMFSINIDSSLSTVLSLDIKDLTKHREIFYQKLIENGFDVYLVRLCEVSLFLSMLPLHMDNPRKVFAFILNAINILKELKSYAK